MIAIIFLIVSFLFGWCLMSRILPEEMQKDTVKIALSVILGIFICVCLTFLLNIFLTLPVSITISLYTVCLSCFFIAPLKKNKHFLFSVSVSRFDYILWIIFTIVAILLINQSLHFTLNNFLQIGANEWGDFELHLPLIRSFAWGNNMLPSLPFFPNANASYHFMFDYWSALLEYGGLPLAFAFNIASIISFSTMLFCLYKFVSILFHNEKFIGILTVVLFLFNSTLGFVEAYQKLFPKNLLDFSQKIMHNNRYLSSGPFTSDHVSIIWNMNVYLNQRHLLFGFAIGLAILLLFSLLIKKHLHANYFILIGVLIGLIPIWDIYIFLCILLIVGILPLLYIQFNRKLLLILPVAILIAIPQLLWLSHNVRSFIQFDPGFLAPPPLTIQGFVVYWFYNLGISLFTIPLGFILANKQQKKWFLAIVAIFVIGNLVQFNSVMFNNHKLFNFWLMLSNGYTAFVIYRILTNRFWWKWGIVIALIFLLTFSGIIDMFVIKNETFYAVSDYTENTTLQWFAKNTSQNSIVLVPSYGMYDPIRMAGRKTFVPFPRFAGEFGYDTVTRNQIIQEIYQSNNIKNVSLLLKKNNITYVEIPKNNTGTYHIKNNFFEGNFPIVYSTSDFDLLAIP